MDVYTVLGESAIVRRPSTIYVLLFAFIVEFLLKGVSSSCVSFIEDFLAENCCQANQNKWFLSLTTS
jgi:hypothetical protein